MIIGPVLTIGGLIALFFVLGGEIPTRIPPAALIVLGALTLWVVLLKVLPKKICYVCGGKGHFGIWFMRRKCDRCRGGGLINRIGASDD